LKFKTDRKLNKRPKKSKIFIGISAITAIGIIPFVIFRANDGDWVHATFDATLVLIFTFNGLYLYMTGKDKWPRMLFAASITISLIIVLYLKADQYSLWSYPGLVALFFVVRPKLAAMFCATCILWTAFVLYPKLDFLHFQVYIFSLSLTCAAVYVFANITHQQRKALTSLSITDPLTNLLNRRAFDRKMDECIGTIRDGQNSSLILFDIDHFKSLNDEFGHSIGDDVLQKLGLLISKRMRKADKIYRIGGEEFAIVLSSTACDSAKEVAANIRELVETSRLIADRQVTISLGIAEYYENETKDSWFKRCDEALYLAKNSGRNNFKLAKLHAVS